MFDQSDVFHELFLFGIFFISSLWAFFWRMFMGWKHISIQRNKPKPKREMDRKFVLFDARKVASFKIEWILLTSYMYSQLQKYFDIFSNRIDYLFLLGLSKWFNFFNSYTYEISMLCKVCKRCKEKYQKYKFTKNMNTHTWHFIWIKKRNLIIRYVSITAVSCVITILLILSLSRYSCTYINIGD